MKWFESIQILFRPKQKKEEFDLRILGEVLKNPRAFDALSALRGPDSDALCASSIKSLTTEVIRHLLGVAFLSTSPSEAQHHWHVITPDRRQECQDFWHTQSHFRSHIVAALRAINTSESRDYLTWLYAITR